jgi:hypothetical protein
MYKYASGQITLNEFNQPLGMELSPSNEWVILRDYVPWSVGEAEYSKPFIKSRDGQPVVPFQLVFGALIIKMRYSFSDRETVRQIQMNPYFQYFCGMRSFKTERPFHPSLLTHVRKRLTPEMLDIMNEALIKLGEDEQDKKRKQKQEQAINQDQEQIQSDEIMKSTLIIDATCAPSNIKYPVDISLLYDAYIYTM